MLAIDMIIRHGFLAGKRVKDDTAGRAAFEPMAPEDIVERAFALACAFWEVADKRYYSE